MPKIPEETIQEIKEKVDLVTLCRSRGIKLKKTGANYIGRCPFHNEKTASFVVTPSKQLWHCFGCNQGGNVIQLVQLLDRLSFPEAVAALSTEATKTAAKKKISSLNSRHSCAHFFFSRPKLLSLVSDYYHATFNQQKTGRDYLKQRGLVDPALFSRFKVGFCAGNIRESMPKDDQKAAELKELGVLTENGREFFTSCVVFPIPDHSGQIVNIYGRRIRNGQVNHLYLPGKKSGVFNGASIQSADPIILVESILDALALIQAGYPGAIPCYGSTGIPEDHLSILINFTEKPVYLCFDADNAGRKAAVRAKCNWKKSG